MPLLPSVLLGSDKHSRPHSPKTTAIFKAFTATYKKICCCHGHLATLSSVVFVFLPQRWSLAGHSDAQQPKEKTVILLPFCAARPAAWFAFAESKFREKAIISQWRRFDLLLAAMPGKILDQVMDMVGNITKMPEDFPYDMLKACLMETHTLSDHEKLDVLYKSEPLGGRNLSKMLASILAYCPSGMEQTIMFKYMFLPVTLQTLLGEQEPVTSGAWRPGRTSCGPLTSHSLTVWWPV